LGWLCINSFRKIMKHSNSILDRTSHNIKSELYHRFNCKLDDVVAHQVCDDVEMRLTKQLDGRLSRQFTANSNAFSRKGRIA
jgi:hypothetical protein